MQCVDSEIEEVQYFKSQNKMIAPYITQSLPSFASKLSKHIIAIYLKYVFKHSKKGISIN